MNDTNGRQQVQLLNVLEHLRNLLLARVGLAGKIGQRLHPQHGIALTKAGARIQHALVLLVLHKVRHNFLVQLHLLIQQLHARTKAVHLTQDERLVIVKLGARIAQQTQTLFETHLFVRLTQIGLEQRRVNHGRTVLLRHDILQKLHQQVGAINENVQILIGNGFRMRFAHTAPGIAIAKI